MATGKPRTTLGLKTQHSRVKSDWHSATRQAKRDVIRMGWARHVLEEEGAHPLTHSVASVRRARNIVASIQNEQPRYR
jgi:hypothetical protein